MKQRDGLKKNLIMASPFSVHPTTVTMNPQTDEKLPEPIQPIYKGGLDNTDYQTCNFCLIASRFSSANGPNFLILSVNILNNSAAFLYTGKGT